MWKLCLDVAAGGKITVLLEEYVAKYADPLSSELHSESAAWFLHDERVLEAMDVDELDAPSPSAMDSDRQASIASAAPPPPSESPRSCSPTVDPAPKKGGNWGGNWGRKRGRETTPPAETVRRSTRLQGGKGSVVPEQAVVPKQAESSSSGRHTRSKIDHPTPKKAKRTAGVDTLGSRMQLMYEVHQKFVRPSLWFMKTKTNDKISKLNRNM